MEPEAVPGIPGEEEPAHPAGSRSVSPSRAGRGQPPRLRRRAAAVLLLVALVAGSGVILQRLGPRALGIAPTSGSPSGAWLCPHGGVADGTGWVVITNPGVRPVRARLSTFGSSGLTGRSSFSIPADRQVYRQVPATDPASSSEVEFFGGWVGVAAVVVQAGSHPAAAAERCVQPVRRDWYLPDGTTAPGDSSTVVVMNPFSETASFEFVIQTEQRRLTPGPLDPYVLPPHTAVSISLNQYALAGPGERTITARVLQRTGRVVAGGISGSTGSLREEAGVPIVQQRWILPGAGYAGTGELALVDPGERGAGLSVVGQSSSGQKLVSGENGIQIAGTQVRTQDLTLPQNNGLVTESMNHVGFVVTRRLTGSRGDQATIDGAARGSARWLVVPSLPPSGGLGLLILENAGRIDAKVSVRLIGANGPVAAPLLAQVSVSAGRMLVVGLQGVAGRAPVSAIVVASTGTLVAASASYSLDGLGYAATLGMPMTDRG
jgi:hypothetical protein